MSTFAGRYSEVFIAPSGRPLASAEVTVRQRGTLVAATLYTDRLKTVVADNPIETDDLGNGVFFATPGEYDLYYNLQTFPVTVFDDPFEPEIVGVPVTTGPLGWIVPDAIFSLKVMGRQEVAAGVRQAIDPSGDKPNVIFESRGEPGVLDYVWLAMSAAAVDPLENLGRIRVYLDDEDTPAVDVSINDFFMSAEQNDTFGTPVVGRTYRVGNLATYQGAPATGYYRYLFAPFQGYCRVEYVNRGTVQPALWMQASAVLLSGPITGAAQSYTILTNDTQTAELLPPGVDPAGNAYAVATNPAYASSNGVPPANKLTICSVDGAGVLESVWVAVGGAISGQVWIEANMEIYVDGETRPSWISTGGEDIFNGAFGVVAEGGFPAGGSQDGVAASPTWYRFFLGHDRVRFTDGLVVKMNVGQRGQQSGLSWPTGNFAISGFAGVWLTEPPTENYRKITGVTTGYDGDPEVADDFAGSAGNLNGRAAPADGETPGGSAWVSDAGWQITGSGAAQITGLLTDAGDARFNLGSALGGTDYWLEGRVSITEPTALTNGTMTTNTTNLPVAAGQLAALGTPSAPFDVQIDTEIMTVTVAANTAGNWTVTRGQRLADGGVAGSTHSSGATVRLCDGSGGSGPEVGIAARSLASGSGLGDSIIVELQRVGPYYWIVKTRDGFDNPQSLKIDRGVDLNGVDVDLAVLVRGTKAVAYWKFSDESRWQPVGSWTTVHGAVGQNYAGLWYWAAAQGATAKVSRLYARTLV